MTRQTNTGLPRTPDQRTPNRNRLGRDHRKRSASPAICVLLALMAGGLASPGIAQSADNESAAPANAATTLSVVRWNGSLPEAAGRSVELRFALYEEQIGGSALWSETQTVKVGADGRYVVLLGVTSAEGLPPTLFQSSDAKWIEARPVNAPEETSDTTAIQPRTLLAIVPYAFKAQDAETLSGHSAADFVTQDQLTALQGAPSGAGPSPIKSFTSPPVTGSGTANTFALWTGTSTIGPSLLYQGPLGFGIKKPAPVTTLEVGGNTTDDGYLTMSPFATATTTAGGRSNLIEFSSSVWSSTTSAPTTQNFRVYAIPEGNNTASPSAALQFQYEPGTGPATNILSISSNGNINWSPTQTFPITGTGGGTITGITTSSPLTGSGTTGSVALGLNTSVLETTLNNVYAQLGTSNTFAGEVLAQQATGTGYGALVGIGTNGSIGTYGRSDTGYGVEGDTTSGSGVYGYSYGTGYAGYFINNTTASSALYAENDAAGNPGLGIALKGYVPNSNSIAALGRADGDSSYGVYGEDVGGTDSYGVFGSTSGPGSTAIYGVATGGADGNNVTGSGVVGISSTGNGVQGGTLGTSTTGTELGPNGPWGLWGDIGNTGNAQLGAGILGTADNYSAAFLRNNGASATLVANNSGQGPAATFAGYSTFQEFPTVYVGNSSTGGAGEMVNSSNHAVTLYLSNNGTGGITDAVSKVGQPTNGALFKTLMASTPTGTCGIGGNGDLSCTGQVKSLVSTRGGGRKVETYAPQSAENWMEDYGTGKMELGVAVVKIDTAFAETVSETPDYHVFITPNADSKGLYVINKTLTSFEVRESGGGTSSLTFDYKIVARRNGYESQRLVDVTDRFNAESAAVIARKPAAAPQFRAVHPPVSAKPNPSLAIDGPEPAHPAHRPVH